MIAQLTAQLVAAYRERCELAQACARVDAAVERALAGELLRDVSRDIELTRAEHLVAARRLDAAKPKPPPVRRRPVYRRAF